MSSLERHEREQTNAALDGVTDRLAVTRYCKWNETLKTMSGDYLRVGNIDLGEFRDLVDAEYQRAARENPANPAFHMRPMWFTNSPYGEEILRIAEAVRGISV